jgi:hypothetical protein
LAEYQTYKISKENTDRLQQEEVVQKNRTQLRREAQVARQNFKRGQYLQRQIEAGRKRKEMMSSADYTLVVLYRAGDLDRRRNRANAAYGFGTGTITGLSVEEIMTRSLEERPLRVYMEQD